MLTIVKVFRLNKRYERQAAGGQQWQANNNCYRNFNINFECKWKNVMMQLAAAVVVCGGAASAW